MYISSILFSEETMYTEMTVLYIYVINSNDNICFKPFSGENIIVKKSNHWKNNCTFHVCIASMYV